MQLPFEPARNAEPLEGFQIGQMIPGTNFHVQSKLAQQPGYADYAVTKSGSNRLYVCEFFPVEDSEFIEIAATNSLFCKGRTNSEFIANIVEAAWLADGAYYQVVDVLPHYRIWTDEYHERIISAPNFRAAAYQLMNALLYLHKTEIVHAAISPASILLDDNAHKLSGFWWARNLVGQTFDSRLENFYPVNLAHSAKMALAPEIAEGNTPTRASDIFSLGATFFFMLTGEYPFKSINKAARPEYLAELRSDLPPPMVQGVQMMLAQEPSERDMFGIMSLLAPLQEELDDEPELKEV